MPQLLARHVGHGMTPTELKTWRTNRGLSQSDLATAIKHIDHIDIARMMKTMPDDELASALTHLKPLDVSNRMISNWESGQQIPPLATLAIQSLEAKYKPVYVSFTPTEFRAWLNKHGISQARIARELHVTPGAITLWLKGARSTPPFPKDALKQLEKLPPQERASPLRRAVAEPDPKFVELQANLGLNQRQIAERLGVEESTVHRWKYGYRTMPDSEIRRLEGMTKQTPEPIEA
jgi:transcriptional regulator with XRE-family HTH domain